MNAKSSCKATHRPVRAIAALLMLTCCNATASNGMNAAGIGSVQLGMAGAGTALASEAAATLRNPAAGVWLGNMRTAEIGIAVPDGGYRAGAVGPNASFGLLDLQPGRNTSVTGAFSLPAFARNWRIDDRTAWGWGVSASGLKALSDGGTAIFARGVPTLDARCDGDFGGGQPLSVTADPSRLCGYNGTKLGVDLTQALISAHWAYRVAPSFSVGIGPVLAAQRIEIHGLGAFAAFSNLPDRTTNRGFDYAYGGGARLGFLWEVVPGFGIGAAYQTKLWQTAFEKYRGAIIGGSLDFAPVINLGVQLHLMKGHRLFLDYEQVRYGDIKPLANQVSPQRFTDGCFVPRLFTRNQPDPPDLDACLGAPDGPGFGWDTIEVYKIGYQGHRDRLTWRAGFSWGGNPVVRGQALSKVFAPAVTDRHAALGFSWRLSPQLELGGALIYAIRNRTRERNSFSNATPMLAQGSLISFDVGADENDQVIESHLSVWQSQISLTWFLKDR